jgi:4-hydroxy-tetrahydrodipicolinate synthase
MIPALKAVIAHYAQDPCWETVRPPFTGLSSSQHDDLLDKLRALDFTMPDIRA